jgi:hypothetical protein
VTVGSPGVARSQAWRTASGRRRGGFEPVCGGAVVCSPFLGPAIMGINRAFVQ